MAHDSSNDDRIAQDRETIRQWADEHDVTPVRTGGSEETGAPYRLESDPEGSDVVETVSWSEFFEVIQSEDLVVVNYGERTDRGFDVVDREGAGGMMPLESEAIDANEATAETEAPVKTDAHSEIGVPGETPEETEAPAEPGAPEETGPPGEPGAPAETGMAAESGTPPETGAGVAPDEAVRTTPTDEDVGKDVVDAEGDTVGMVEAVREGTAYVDPDPGIVNRIKATLEMGDVDEDAYPIEASQIRQITDDAVELSVPR